MDDSDSRGISHSSAGQIENRLAEEIDFIGSISHRL